MWQVYVQINRLLFRRFPGLPFDRALVRAIAESAESYADYRKTLAAKDLEGAISNLIKAKSLTPSVRRHSEYSFLLKGNTSLKALAYFFRIVRARLDGKTSSAEFRVLLRPDLVIQKRKLSRLASGFVIVARFRNRDELKIALREIGELATAKDVEVNSVTLFLPSLQIHGLLLRNLDELLPTLEAASEVEIAYELCLMLEEFDLFHVYRIDSTLVAKLYMVAQRDLPYRMAELGWKKVERVKPDWEPALEGLSMQRDRADHMGPASGGLSHSSTGMVSLTAIVHDALVFMGDTVVSKNRLLEIDDAANPSHDFVAGRHFDVVGTHLNLKEAVVRIPVNPESVSGSAILLSTRADVNWFHWLIETLPKLFIADSSIDAAVPLLISSRIPPTAKDSLALLSQRKVIEFDSIRGVTLDELHIISPVIFNPDTLHMWLSENSNQLNKDAITALRNTVLNRLLPAERDSNYPDKLFVARRTGARGLVNGLSIRRMLRRIGFVSFEPETRGFADQVLAFNKAHTIVMVGGASMANLIFCHKGAKVIFLSSTLVLPNRLVSVLADIASATVVRVAGPIVGGMFRSSLLEKIHSHYRIPISELKQSLRTPSPEEA